MWLHCACCLLVVSESVFVTVEPSTGEPQLHIVPNLMSFWQFASTRSDNDPDTSRLGRLQDVREFVKILDHTIMKPVKHKEFMVSCYIPLLHIIGYTCVIHCRYHMPCTVHVNSVSVRELKGIRCLSFIRGLLVSLNNIVVIKNNYVCLFMLIVSCDYICNFIIKICNFIVEVYCSQNIFVIKTLIGELYFHRTWTGMYTIDTRE